jgi:hypothetical protein
MEKKTLNKFVGPKRFSMDNDNNKGLPPGGVAAPR